MILNAFGICGLGVAELGVMLSNLDYGYAVVVGAKLQQVGMKHENGKQPLVPVIFKGAKSFLNNYHRFKKRDVLCFIIDTPMELSFLNVKLLGVTPASKYVFKFTRLDEKILGNEIGQWVERNLEEEDKFVVDYKPSRVLADIVSSYQDNSVLAPLQTFLYTIKEKDKRKSVDTAVKQWLTTVSSFEKAIKKCSRVLPESKLNYLISVVSTPKFKRLKQAAAQYKKHPEKLASIATQFKVSTFDLRYLIHPA